MSVTISNEYLTAKINLIGAELKSLKSNKNIEYIWYSDPVHWKKSAPFLFPIIGRLKNNKTIIKDKEYEMTNHGFLQYLPFEVISHKAEEVTLITASNLDTLKQYPFEFKVLIIYKLMDNTLRTKIRIINPTDEKMYFNIGGHPAINCPIYKDEDFTDYSIYFEKSETFDSPFVLSDATLNFNKPARSYQNLNVLQLNRELFDIDTIVIPSSKSKSVKLLNKNNKGIKFDFPRFITFAIWTPFNTEAPFVCLEPWNGNNDHHDTSGSFLEKDNLISLGKKGEHEVYYDITIID